MFLHEAVAISIVALMSFASPDEAGPPRPGEHDADNGEAKAIAEDAANPASDRPRVVSTEPEHGEDGVAIDLAQIVVTFDRPMTVGSHSWVGGGELFPELAGEPTWIDDRTAALPVRLRPDSDYQLAINSTRFDNFRGADGAPAIPMPLVFSTREWPMPTHVKEIGIERLRDALLRRYSYRDRLGIDWKTRLAAYEPKLREVDSSLRFAALVSEMVAPAEDPHLWVKARSLTLPNDWRERRERRRDLTTNFEGRAVGSVVGPAVEQHGRGVISANIGPDVGYILIPVWGASTGEAALAALESLEDVGSLIIDVRPNGGGAEAEAARFAGAFVTAPVVYAKRRHIDPATGEISEPLDAVLEPHETTATRPRRVYVLVGPTTMSSCEGFCLMMRAAGAELVGERTAGSSGNPQPVRVGGGILMYVPSWIALDAEGHPLEGIGIEPDVVIETDPADLATTDPVLAQTLERAKAAAQP